MKINRVILATNNNPLYYDFWNPLSKVYKEKFGIEPTLVWLGTEDEYAQTNLTNEYGEVLIVEPNPNYRIAWQSTWSLFWATQHYPEDTCIIMGIDQVPLSTMFFDMVKDVPEDGYAMLIDDAYLPHYWNKDGSASPSSYHVAKGKTYSKVYGFELEFSMEAKKVYESGVKAFWEEGEGLWGIDETYSCDKLRKSGQDVSCFSKFGLLQERRIECERHKETAYDLNRLQQGWYSESHLCRPFSNHVNYITKLFNDIPCFTKQQ
jgi:hypothetical protein